MANFSIPLRYKVLFVFLIWGAAVLFFFLRYDAYGLQENAARALMFVWSIVDGVAHPVVVLGVPDFRALLFIPIGLMWTGSIPAAKVFTLLILAASALLLHDWSRRTQNQESALIATGLLLVSPLALAQVDSIGTGIYLLLVPGLAYWLDRAYRENPRPLGGWYFSQIFLIAFSVSLHPAGLAYPLSLLWQWHRQPVDARQQRHYYVGVASITLFVLLIRMGWNGLSWWVNPIQSLVTVVLGPSADMTTLGWMTGGIVFAALIFALFRRENLGDMARRTLTLGVLLGLPSADSAWAMLVLGFLLYVGVPLLIKAHESIPGDSFMAKRSGVVAFIFIVATTFMVNDRANYDLRRLDPMPSRDRLIAAITQQTRADEKAGKRVLVASEWPGRTMIACKCDVLPLPSPAKDPKTQLEMLKGVDYLMFNPRHHEILGRNIAMLGQATETLSIQSTGVIIRIRK
ncbi:MAG TPA: hypothetical protein PLK99_00480 [Burkholderiales bacterium]|nr:hypothetical protein [Burkholderiales bacterium]